MYTLVRQLWPGQAQSINFNQREKKKEKWYTTAWNNVSHANSPALSDYLIGDYIITLQNQPQVIRKV